MNYGHFFTSHHWWGKLIGALLGYLTFGAAGALFGILIGNLFDKGLALHLSRPHWQYHDEHRENVQNIFFEATFSVMGHISKADGRVTEEQIQGVKHLMEDLRLNHAQRQLAQQFFREGKQPDFDFWSVLSILRESTRHNPELLKLFIDLQFQIALVGGLSAKKQELLNRILAYMGFAPLHQQHRFYEDFSTQETYQRSSHRPHSHSTGSGRNDHAYSILGVSRTATQKEVKHAYRQLMSRNHPDKLIAKGLPEAMIKIANEKTQKIRKAYEAICEEKGW